MRHPLGYRYLITHVFLRALRSFVFLVVTVGTVQVNAARIQCP